MKVGVIGSNFDLNIVKIDLRVTSKRTPGAQTSTRIERMLFVRPLKGRPPDFRVIRNSRGGTRAQPARLCQPLQNTL